jgi:hypothetical protein
MILKDKGNDKRHKIHAMDEVNVITTQNDAQKCYKCGEPGHFRRDCNKCGFCKKTGHTANDCPNNDSNKYQGASRAGYNETQGQQMQQRQQDQWAGNQTTMRPNAGSTPYQRNNINDRFSNQMQNNQPFQQAQRQRMGPQAFQQREQDMGYRRPQMNPPNPWMARREGWTGNQGRRPPYNGQRYQTSQPDLRRCNYCDQVGHIEIRCWKKQANQRGQNNSGPRRGNNENNIPTMNPRSGNGEIVTQLERAQDINQVNLIQ